MLHLGDLAPDTCHEQICSCGVEVALNCLTRVTCHGHVPGICRSNLIELMAKLFSFADPT